MTLNLPENPSLEHLKRQAKRLHKALLAGEAEALRLAREFHPRFSDRVIESAFQLADAQLVLARQYGFPSWPALRQYVALRDPAILRQAFETVKDGWIKPEHLPGDPAKLRRMLRDYPGLVHTRIGTRGYTLLHYAAYRNYVEIAHVLLKAGADVHARANGGATPLAVALTYPAPDVAAILVPYGLVPCNIRIAAGLGDMELLRGYFDADGHLKPEAGQDREGWAASYEFSDRPLSNEPGGLLAEGLMYAAQNGQLAAMEFLLEKGAEVNRIVFAGSALHCAALYNQRPAVEVLLAHGADVNLKDLDYGATAAGWANYFGNRDIEEYLRGLETKVDSEEGAEI